MSSVLIKNGTLITMNPAREVIKSDILIHNGRIAAISQDLQHFHHPLDEVLDVGGCVVIPGLIQAHIHLTQTLFRGLADDLELLDWLRRRIWPCEAAHTYESNSLSARLGIAELINSGTTSIVDMGTVHHSEAIFEAARETGIRGLFGKCMMDSGLNVPAGLMENAEVSLAESERLLGRWHDAANGRIRYAFAPRFALSCTKALMLRVRDAARAHGVKVHTHSSENRDEIALVEQSCGLRNVQYFKELGMTGPDLILAHCIWLDDAEMRVLADSGTHVVHCPSSNMKLASGMARVVEMLEAGINVGIGCDGPPSNNSLDPFIEMRHAAMLQKVRLLSPTALPAMQALEMATVNGAKVMGQEDDIGSIEVGKKADLVVLDFNRLHSSPAAGRDPVALTVYEATADNVRHTMIDGRLVLRDKRHTTLNVPELLREAEKAAAEQMFTKRGAGIR